MIQSWNIGAERIFGYTPEEAIGNHVRCLIPLDRQEEEPILQRIVAGERIDHYETVRWHKDGGLIDVSLTVSPMRNGQGQIIGASKIARNITRQKLAHHREQQLFRLATAVNRALALPELYEQALDAITLSLGSDRASILLFDPDGTMRFKAWRGLSDVYRAAVEGHSPWKPDTQTPSPIVMGDIEAADVSSELKTVIRQEVIRALAFIPLTYGGHLIGKFMVYFPEPRPLDDEEVQLARAIADTLALGIERRRTEEVLKQSESQLRQALEAGRMGSWEWDLITNTVSWCPRLEAIHGRSPGTFDGSFESFKKDIHPDDRERVLASIEKTLNEGTQHQIEYRIILPDGAVQWVEGKGTLYRAKDGRRIRMAGVCSNITERKQAEHALSESQKQVQEELADTKLLQSISAELIHEPNDESLFTKLVNAAVRIMRSDYASLQMFCPERGTKGELRLLASHGFSPEAVKFWQWVSADSHCTCGIALRTGGRVIVPDVRHCSLTAGSEDQTALLEAGILAAQSTPLVSRKGEVVGMISTHWRTPHQPSERSLRLLDIVARQAADLIEHRRKTEEIQVLNERLADDVKALERVQQIRTRLVGSNDLNARLTEILSAAAEITETDQGSIQLYDPETKQLRIAVRQDFGDRFMKPFQNRGPAAVCDGAAHKVERVILEGIPAESALQGTEDLEAILEDGIRAIQSTPLISLDGRRLGLLNNHFGLRRRPTDRELHYLDLLARMAADFIERWEGVQALRGSEERLHRVLETDAVGILFFDYSGLVVNANEVFLRQTGYRREQIERGELHWRTMTPPEWVEASERQMAQFARTGRIGPYEKQYFLADGSRRWMLFAGRDLGDGTIAEYCVDITERKEAQLRLERFSEELEQQVLARTADVVETQERLRALATELNLAEQRERKRLAAELHDHLQQTLVLGKFKVGQAKRLVQTMPECMNIIREFDEVLTEALTYTRTLVAELSPPALREHGLAAGLRWLAEYMKKHDMTVLIQVPEEVDLKLPEDQAVLLFQSVRELLINAAKHAQTDHASVTLRHHEDYLLIQVQDDGQGFDVSHTTAPNEQSSRFGLFSIKERMKALGGSFAIESVLGEGTTAVLTLPLISPPEMHLQNGQTVSRSEHAQNRHAVNAASSSVIRLLLVDDHAMMRQGLRTMLEQYADIALVGEARDGHEAIDVVDQLRPQVVVMDINMPRLNGIEATARIKEQYPDTCIIGLSVNAQDENQDAMKRAGATLLITKEAAVDELYHAIRAGLGLPSLSLAR